jgi:hypothetical protein
MVETGPQGPQMNRRQFLIGLGAAGAAGALATVLPKAAEAGPALSSPEQQPAAIPTGELPVVEGAPEPIALKDSSGQYSFVEYSNSGNLRVIPRADGDKVTQDPIPTGTVAEIQKSELTLPDGTIIPQGGVGINVYKSDPYLWSHVKLLNEEESTGYTAETVGNTEILTPISSAQLTDAEKQQYMVEEKLNLPSASKSIDLTGIFGEENIGGPQNSQINGEIMNLWGDTPTTKRIRENVGGRLQTRIETTIPTTDELTTPVNALKRVMGLASIEAATADQNPDSLINPNNGILQLDQVGGLKVGSRVTVDIQDPESSAVAATIQTRDIFARVGDRIVVTRIEFDNESYLLQATTTNVGSYDWNGFAAYIGDPKEAKEIASQLTDLGGGHPETLLQQIGGLPQASVAIPTENGGFAPKIDATIANSIFETRVYDSTLKSTYQLDGNGIPTATVTQVGEQPRTLQAIENRAGEMEWVEVVENSDISEVVTIGDYTGRPGQIHPNSLIDTDDELSFITSLKLGSELSTISIPLPNGDSLQIFTLPTQITDPANPKLLIDASDLIVNFTIIGANGVEKPTFRMIGLGNGSEVRVNDNGNFTKKTISGHPLNQLNNAANAAEINDQLLKHIGGKTVVTRVSQLINAQEQAEQVPPALMQTPSFQNVSEASNIFGDRQNMKKSGLNMSSLNFNNEMLEFTPSSTDNQLLGLSLWFATK